MGEDIWHPPEVHAAWESGRRQGHLDKASEISALVAERDEWRAEVERLRGHLANLLTAHAGVPINALELERQVEAARAAIGDSKP